MDESEVCLLQWLESSGGLACLREQCCTYREAEKVSCSSHLPMTIAQPMAFLQPQAVYKLSLAVDPLDLGQHSGMLTVNSTHSTQLYSSSAACLADMLLHCPRQFWPLAQSLCYSVTHSLNWLPQLSSPSQLLLELRLSSLPSLPGTTLAT